MPVGTTPSRIVVVIGDRRLVVPLGGNQLGWADPTRLRILISAVDAGMTTTSANPMVEYLNSLRTQQQSSNSTYIHEARHDFLLSLKREAPWFPDESQLYVRTRLDTLVDDIVTKGKRFRLLFLTGDAGDGKTAFCAALARRLGFEGELQWETVIGGWKIIKDASEVEPDVLAQRIEEQLQLTSEQGLIVAINEGRLRRLFSGLSPQAQTLWKEIVEPALEGWLNKDGAQELTARCSAMRSWWLTSGIAFTCERSRRISSRSGLRPVSGSSRRPVVRAACASDVRFWPMSRIFARLRFTGGFQTFLHTPTSQGSGCRFVDCRQCSQRPRREVWVARTCNRRRSPLPPIFCRTASITRYSCATSCAFLWRSVPNQWRAALPAPTPQLLSPPNSIDRSKRCSVRHPRIRLGAIVHCPRWRPMRFGRCVSASVLVLERGTRGISNMMSRR